MASSKPKAEADEYPPAVIFILRISRIAKGVNIL